MDNNIGYEMSDARLQLHLNVHEPIDLIDMTRAFQAVAFQYKRFMSDKAKSEGKKIADNEVKLYITKIENNCILAELAGAIAMLGGTVAIVGAVNTFVDFAGNLSKMIDWCKVVGKKGVIPKDIPYKKPEYDRVNELMKIAASHKDGELGLKVVEYNEKLQDASVHLKVTYSSDEAYYAQKGALLAMQGLEVTEDADHKNVSMYFYQTNTDDPKAFGRTGDKAVIRSISKDPLPVYFVSDLDQQKISYLIHEKNKNPFTISLNVDVNVELNRKDEPRFYRVIRVHDVYDD